MDKKITFRFYEIKKHKKGQVSFYDALDQIGKIKKPSDREQKLTADFDVRLEQLKTETGNILVGELTRIQSTNLPSEIKGDERIPLTTNNPLGHGVVFRYLKSSSILGIQYDVRVASPGRLVQYVQQMVDDSTFFLEPIVRKDMWNRFNAGESKKVTIAIAGPANLEDVQRGSAHAAATSIKAMAEAYDAPTVTIELSMGGKKGHLAEATKNLVKYFRDKAVSGDIDVRKLQATVKDGEEPSDVIDLLEDILSIKTELPLDDKDPDKNYTIKQKALKEHMNAWNK